MIMHDGNFSMIFYPQTLEGPCPGTAPCSLPQALLLPHASYQWIGEELEAAYHCIDGAKPQSIVILAPIHQDRRPSMGEHWLFVPADDGVRLGNTEARFDANAIASLVRSNPSVVQMDDAVFMEEPDWELHAAMCASHFPSVPLIPIMGCGGLDSGRVKTLASLLSPLVTDKTILIVTSNATSMLPSKPAWAQLSAFAGALSHGEPLLDKGHKGIIGACGYGLIEATGRLKWFSGQWDILSLSVNNNQFTRVPEGEIPYEGDDVWHLCAIAGRSRQ
jgi:AmmeMemoRadiSam system protein B